MRHHLPQQLDAFAPLLDPNIDGDPGDVAAWPRQARHNANSRLPKIPTIGIVVVAAPHVDGVVRVDDNDQIRIAAHDVAGQVRIMRGTSLPGILVNQEIFSLDISQTMEFVKKTRSEAFIASIGEFVYRVRGINDGNPVSFFALLRVRAADGGNDQ
jgi:hypothetical protein